MPFEEGHESGVWDTVGAVLLDDDEVEADDEVDEVRADDEEVDEDDADDADDEEAEDVDVEEETTEELEELEELIMLEVLLPELEALLKLFLYKLNPLGPPQYSVVSAEHNMLQRPSVAGVELDDKVEPQ